MPALYDHAISVPLPLIKYTPEVCEAIEHWEGIYSAPAPRNRKQLTGIAVLDNAFLETYFGTSHPVTPGVWFIPIISYGVYATWRDASLAVPWAVALFFAGVLLWTFVEYWLHRIVFHRVPKATTFAKKLGPFVMHGYHHEFPSDPLRLVAPPALSWPIACVLAPTYYLVLGPELFWPVFAGTIAGYLAYDWTHWYTHHARPKTGVGRFLRRYHMEHHFKDATTHFGLSSPLWDLVFGTFSRPTEPTELEIELTPDHHDAAEITRAKA